MAWGNARCSSPVNPNCSLVARQVTPEASNDHRFRARRFPVFALGKSLRRIRRIAHQNVRVCRRYPSHFLTARSLYGGLGGPAQKPFSKSLTCLCWGFEHHHVYKALMTPFFPLREVNQMLPTLAAVLVEHQAVIGLQLARAANAPEHNVVATCRHVMRSVYAHLSALKQLVIPALNVCTDTEQLQSAIETTAVALAIMAAADGTGGRDGLAAVSLSLNSLVAAEIDLLASSVASTAGSDLTRLAAEVDEHFVALYGRDEEPRAEWASTQETVLRKGP